MYEVPYRPPAGPEPPNHLVWAILTTLFCCLPFGIVSIVYAAQVSSKWAGGDYAGAMSASRNAKQWAIIAAVSVVLPVVLLFLFGAFGTLVRSTST